MYTGPNIVTDGLELLIDAKNTKSYPGSGTICKDLSKTGNDTTLVNGVLWNSDGYFSFDGANDYITHDELTYTVDTDDWSWSMWQYKKFYDGNVTWDSIIGSTLYNGGSWMWHFNKLYHDYYESTGYGITFHNTVLGTQVPWDCWNNIAVSYDSNTHYFHVYVNGILTESQTMDFTPRPGYNYFKFNWIGASWSSVDTFDGDIATTSIYNKALSSQEVLQNYNALKGRFNK